MKQPKIVLFSLLVAIISGSLVYLSSYHKITSLEQGILELEKINNNCTSNCPNIAASNLQTYKNTAYSFEFKYPSTLGFVNPAYANLEEKIIQLQIPQTDYPKTNFGDAAFSISATYTKSLSECLSKNPPENSDGFKTKVQINGQEFYMTKGAGVGAGNLYESNNYRLLTKDKTCLELNETIHTGNIANYTPGEVSEVNKNGVQTRLDEILKTFKLN
ncbi:MAG: hypothetical protein WCK59_03035 [Candidatus Falkowbacteria bacterium]